MTEPKEAERWRFPFTALAVALVVLAVAAGLRLVGLHWELPNRRHLFSFHPDEIFLLLPSIQYFSHGDWNPHFFNYGTLYLYLVGIPAVLSGMVKGPINLSGLYLLGRTITAVMGIGTVAVLYFAVKRESRRVAAVSALLLAVLPLHAVNSHYATVDVPSAFWLALAFLFTLRGAEKPGWPLAIFTGLVVGLAAATKYNVGLFLLPVVVAPLLLRGCHPERREAKPNAAKDLPSGLASRNGVTAQEGRSLHFVQGKLFGRNGTSLRMTTGRIPRLWPAGVVLGALVGFLIGCPHVSDPQFAHDFLFELNHARIGGTTAFVNTGSGWGYHLLHGLPIALGFPLLLALALGIIVTIRTPSRAARLSLLWCALYLLMIGFSKERFIRYLIPMTPFIAVIAAQGLVWLWRAPRRRAVRLATGAVGFAVLALTGLYTFEQVAAFSADDPRERAWSKVGPVIVGLNPGGQVHLGLVQAPWFFSPPVSPYNGGPLSLAAFVRWDQEVHNRIVITGWDPARLEAARPWAFVVSDLESQDLLRLKNPDAIRFMAALDRTYKYRLVVANPPAPFSWLAPGRAWAPPDWLYLWPQITLYTNHKLSPDEPRS